MTVPFMSCFLFSYADPTSVAWGRVSCSLAKVPELKSFSFFLSSFLEVRIRPPEPKVSRGRLLLVSADLSSGSCLKIQGMDFRFLKSF